MGGKPAQVSWVISAVMSNTISPISGMGVSVGGIGVGSSVTSGGGGVGVLVVPWSQAVRARANINRVRKVSSFFILITPWRSFAADVVDDKDIVGTIFPVISNDDIKIPISIYIHDTKRIMVGDVVISFNFTENPGAIIEVKRVSR